MSAVVAAVVATLLLAAGCATAAAGPSASDICGEPEPVALSEAFRLPNSPTFERMTQRGHVVVGIKADQPMLGYKTAANDRCGFDVDIARLISAGLGFDPSRIEYREIPSANREASIQAGEVDYYVGSYSINDKRKKLVSFAGPYLDTGQSLLVRSGDTIEGRHDLWDRKVCSTTGTTSIQRIKDERLTQPQNIVEFRTGADCVSQLVDGGVDAFTTDDAILKGYAAAVPGLQVVGGTFSVERYGVGLQRDDDALRDALNDILQRAAGDGTWQRLYDSTLGRSGTPSTPPALDRY